MKNDTANFIIKEIKNLNIPYFQDIEENISDNIDNERYISEYILQYKTNIINEYKNELPTLINLIENNMVEFTRSYYKGRQEKRVYRGIVIESIGELTIEQIENKIFNYFRTNKDDYFSVTEDLCIANEFADIGRTEYINSGKDFNCEKNNFKKYGIVFELGINKGFIIQDRDIGESEILTKLDFVTRIDIKYIYEIKYIKSTLN